jgi:hypothetical protein
LKPAENGENKIDSKGIAVEKKSEKNGGYFGVEGMGFLGIWKYLRSSARCLESHNGKQVMEMGGQEGK